MDRTPSRGSTSVPGDASERVDALGADRFLAPAASARALYR